MKTFLQITDKVIGSGLVIAFREISYRVIEQTAFHERMSDKKKIVRAFNHLPGKRCIYIFKCYQKDKTRRRSRARYQCDRHLPITVFSVTVYAVTLYAPFPTSTLLSIIIILIRILVFSAFRHRCAGSTSLRVLLYVFYIQPPLYVQN